MSDARFASITSTLLTRRGQAAPSLVGASVRAAPVFGARTAAVSVQEALWNPPSPAYEAKPTPLSSEVRPAVPPPAPPPGEPKMPARPAPAPQPTRTSVKRRVVVTLTAEEYRRLGIVAAKANSTRQELVRDAVFQRLDSFAHDQAPECRCISSGDGCDCAPPATRADTGS